MNNHRALPYSFLKSGSASQSDSHRFVTIQNINEIAALKLIGDKMKLPVYESQIFRPRLHRLLEKLLIQFKAVAVTGRAGSGKTALVAEFIRRNKISAAWYAVESAESDWELFVGYLLGAMLPFCRGCDDKRLDELKFSFETADIRQVAEALASCLTAETNKKSLIIVLEDVHNIFDSCWFNEFLQIFTQLLPSHVNLLLIARTPPPFPVWRMRSKQMLGMIDEKMLAFTPDETIQLFKDNRLPHELADNACRNSFGRAGKLKHLVDSLIIQNAAAPVR